MAVRVARACSSQAARLFSSMRPMSGQRLRLQQRRRCAASARDGDAAADSPQRLFSEEERVLDVTSLLSQVWAAWSGSTASQPVQLQPALPPLLLLLLTCTHRRVLLLLQMRQEAGDFVFQDWEDEQPIWEHEGRFRGKPMTGACAWSVLHEHRLASAAGNVYRQEAAAAFLC